MQKIPRKLCPKIILEGTRLTHKTEIAFALNEHPRIVGPRKYRYHSPLVSAEWCAFTNFPWGRGMINFLPEEEHLAMETYQTWVRLFELERYYSWIVDRFHISTTVYQSRLGRNYDFGWLEERLSPLGFAIALCTRQESSFPAAHEERLRVSGNPAQYDDLEIFKEEQQDFREKVSASILPHTEIDVTSGNLPEICDAVADWLSQNDLLGMEGSRD